MILLNRLESPAARVEFDRKGDELKENSCGKQDNPNGGQILKREDQPDKKKRNCDFGTDLSRRDDRRTDLHRQIAPVLLDRMPHLVRRHPDCRNRIAVVYRVGKANNIGARVVMVGQIAGNVFNANVLQAVAVEDCTRRHCAGVAPSAAHLAVF